MSVWMRAIWWDSLLPVRATGGEDQPVRLSLACPYCCASKTKRPPGHPTIPEANPFFQMVKVWRERAPIALTGWVSPEPENLGVLFAKPPFSPNPLRRLAHFAPVLSLSRLDNPDWS